jgi:hypothetical protein
MHGWLSMPAIWLIHGKGLLPMSNDDRIFEIAVALIRSASMKHDLWRATALATVHMLPVLPQALHQGEKVIVASAFPNGDWYAWTTRRLIAHCEGRNYEMNAADTSEADFGMFKGSHELLVNPDSPMETLIATVRSSSGRSVKFRYECGYASMAPIQCHKYWTLKHPLIDKLMTPDELANYKSIKVVKD